MKTQYLENIKQFEGFTAKAKWDFAQDSNGYGTKARYAGEVIDRVEAERRFAAEIASAKAAVTRFAPGLDEGTAAALTSLTFNAGPGWMRSGLGEAIKAGDLEAAKQVFVQYVHAGGHRLAGLEARRAVEVQWIGQLQSAVLEANRDGSNVSAAPVAGAAGKDVSAEQDDVSTVVTAAIGSYSAARPGSVATGAGEALAQALFLESIAIGLAARHNQQDREDDDLARPVRA